MPGTVCVPQAELYPPDQPTGSEFSAPTRRISSARDAGPNRLDAGDSATSALATPRGAGTQAADVSAVLIVEEGNTRALRANLLTLRDALAEHGSGNEFVLVQNGSGADGCLKVAGSLWPGVKFVRYARRHSYGVVLRRAIRRSSRDFVLVVDAANEIAPDGIKLMLRSAANVDMLIGCRRMSREGLRATVYAWVWGKLAQFLFGVDAGDVDCPVKLIRRSKLEQIGFLESQGEIFHTELLARMVGAGAEVLECPVQVMRPVGRRLGRVGLATVGWLMLQLARLWFRVRRLRRQHRSETAFHDVLAQDIDVEAIDVRLDFEAATADEKRYCLERMGDLRGRRVLDLGCGAGESSVYLALRGAEVTSVDISAEMVRITRRLAERYDTSVDARVMLAEDLKFDDETFDVVFGNGVLHHTYRPAAYAEVHRVLKPGGIGIFIEPLSYNPLLMVYRWIARAVRTENERPFSYRDFKRLRKSFARVEHREFWLLALGVFMKMFLIEWLHPAKVRYWKHIIDHHERYARLYRKLRRIDDYLLARLPVLGLLAWNSVIVLHRESDPDG